MNIAWPSWRMLAAHCTRWDCSRARLSGGSSTATRIAISSAAPPTDAATITQPLVFFFRSVSAAAAPAAASVCQPDGAGLGSGVTAGVAGAHGRAAGIATGVRLSALNGLAQLLHDSVRPRYSSFCIADIGYGWPQCGHGT